VLGVAGLAGSGQTEMVRAIFGADSDVRGTIELQGQAIRITSPQKAIQAGVAMAPEDRKGQGLLSSLTVRENITLPILRRFRRFFAISERREEEAAQRMIEALSIKVTGSGQIVSQLSGGNQQKVVLAKCLSSAPKVLMLDEPTRGIDVGAKFEIYQLIRNLANQGTAVLFISSELPEILGMSDRILILSRGRLMGVLDRSEATEERIMELATGVSPCAPQTAPEVMGDSICRSG
jgi:ABC-type sugar transport system ATPase subunit